MAPSTAGESAVDRLYQLPLEEFIAARDDLARHTRGEEGRRVRALAKPNIVAWALNQVYWSARAVFEQLLEAAGRLREAQAETLRGRRADLRSADAAHREALGAALAESARILEAAGHSVTPDTLRSLTAAFEALPWNEPPGRLVRPPAPTGFAAFAGMALGLDPQAAPEPAPAAPDVPPSRGRREAERKQPGGDKKGEAAARKAAAQRELEERQRQARGAADDARRAATAAAERLQAASDGVARAREDEQAARMRLEEARRRLQEAENAHQAARRDLAAADAAAREADAAAARLERRTRPGR